MRITIINGEPEAAGDFDAYVASYVHALRSEGHELTVLHVRDLELSNCSGCWGCWVKTPGECVKKDDGAAICRAAAGSDLVVLASPLVMGFTTALLKRAADRLIPLVHPYLVVEGGEVHHRARYRSYPLFGLLLGLGPDSDDEDVAITRDLWARTARNMKSRLVFTTVARDEPAAPPDTGAASTTAPPAPHDRAPVGATYATAPEAARATLKEAAHELVAVA